MGFTNIAFQMLLALQALVIVAAHPHIHQARATDADADAAVATQPVVKLQAIATVDDVLVTKTSTWSISTTRASFNVLAPMYSIFAWTTTGFVTQYEPMPTSFPTSVVVVRISAMVITAAATNAQTTFKTVSTQTWWDTKTWHIYQAQATDMASAEAARLSNTCNDCYSQDYTPDPTCEAMGLFTACQAQCKAEEDGRWWCLKINSAQYWDGPDVRMGRACWGNRTEYKQLNTPCRHGDPLIECESCRGILNDYGPQNWHP
jgi:hypothetical protein